MKTNTVRGLSSHDLIRQSTMLSMALRGLRDTKKINTDKEFQKYVFIRRLFFAKLQEGIYLNIYLDDFHTAMLLIKYALHKNPILDLELRLREVLGDIAAYGDHFGQDIPHGSGVEYLAQYLPSCKPKVFR